MQTTDAYQKQREAFGATEQEFSEEIDRLGWPIIQNRGGSLARCLALIGFEAQRCRLKLGLPLIGAETSEARLARWRREYGKPTATTITAPGATPPAAPKPAPVSASKTPVWDAFNAIKDPCARTRYWDANVNALNAESKIALRKGGGK